MRPQKGSFWESRRDWRHGQRKSGWHASPHWLPQSQARSDRDRERKRDREREREKERERERERESESEGESENESERARERERERDGREPPTAGHSKIWTNLTQKYFQGVILQNYENKLYKIKFRSITYGKLHIRHVIPEKKLRETIPRDLFSS